MALGEAVAANFWHQRRRYGARRIRKQLELEGIGCGLGRVRRLMRDLGLEPLHKRRFVPRTTEAGDGPAPFPNPLLDHPGPGSTEEVWVGL